MNAVPVPGFSRNMFGYRTSSSEVRVSARLRVGLLVESLRLPNWAARLVRQLVDSDFADIALVLVQERGDLAQPSFTWESSLFRTWSRLDRRLNARRGDAFDVCDVAPLLKGICTMAITGSRGEYSSDCLQAMRAANLDVIIALDEISVDNNLDSCPDLAVRQVRSVVASRIQAMPRTRCTNVLGSLSTESGDRGLLACVHAWSGNAGHLPLVFIDERRFALPGAEFGFVEGRRVRRAAPIGPASLWMGLCPNTGRHRDRTVVGTVGQIA